MAKSFAEGLSEADRKILEPLIDSDTQWHLKFWQKTIDLKLESLWKKFRSDLLLRALTEALRKNDVPLRPSPTAATRRQAVSPTHTGTLRPAADDSLRRVMRGVALRAVEHMSISELRADAKTTSQIG